MSQGKQREWIKVTVSVCLLGVSFLLLFSPLSSLPWLLRVFFVLSISRKDLLLFGAWQAGVCGGDGGGAGSGDGG